MIPLQVYIELKSQLLTGFLYQSTKITPACMTIAIIMAHVLGQFHFCKRDLVSLTEEIFNIMSLLDIFSSAVDAPTDHGSHFETSTHLFHYYFIHGVLGYFHL